MGSPFRVAIVGASFAGLSLARALQTTLSVSEVSVSVFEQRHTLNHPPIKGEIRLADGEPVFASLHLSGAWDRLRRGTRVGGDSVPEQPLLLVLARSLRPGTLYLGRRVVRLDELSAEGCAAGPDRTAHRCGVATSSGDSEAFDVVVDATGLASRFAHTSSVAVAVIGDARWAQQACWGILAALLMVGLTLGLGAGVVACLASSALVYGLLGVCRDLHRIRYGANRALLDGIELGAHLSSLTAAGRRQRAAMGRFSYTPRARARALAERTLKEATVWLPVFLSPVLYIVKEADAR